VHGNQSSTCWQVKSFDRCKHHEGKIIATDFHRFARIEKLKTPRIARSSVISVVNLDFDPDEML
jgi:hypothetical protein